MKLMRYQTVYSLDRTTIIGNHKRQQVLIQVLLHDTVFICNEFFNPWRPGLD